MNLCFDALRRDLTDRSDEGNDEIDQRDRERVGAEPMIVNNCGKSSPYELKPSIFVGFILLC